MDTSGTNFHRSNLLGTLAYFGSPAVALRSQASASSLDATALYSRAVVPLSSSTLGETTLPGAADTANNVAPVLVNNDVPPPPAPTPTADHTTVTGPTPGHTETGPTGTTFHTGAPTGHVLTGHLVSQGDPHFTDNGGQEWTQTGVPGDTYLVASGNGVFLSALYGQNGGWDYCTMQCAQVTIPAVAADPANGIAGNPEVQISYGIYDQSQIQVTTTGADGVPVTQNYDASNFGTNGTMTIGGVSVNFQGDVVTINTQTATGQPGTMTIDSSGQLYLEVSLQGTFDGAGGIMQYVAQEAAAGANFGTDQSTMDSYAEANYNLSAIGGADSAMVINPNGQPGFNNWVNSGHSNWNQPWTTAQQKDQ